MKRALLQRLTGWFEAPVAGGPSRPLTEELLKELNELNEGLYFGKAYWRQDELFLAHNLLGDSLEHGDLIAAVGMLAVVADKIDDEFKSKYGGRRWKEPPADEAQEP